MRKSSARLADVARTAGVSLATASRALAEPGLAREDTRAKVEKAAARLGYMPHGAARALASRRSRTIGAVLSGYTAGNDRARERLAGVHEALAARNLEANGRTVETAFTLSHGRAALRQLLERPAGRDFTALVCGNDLLALGAMLECRERGIPRPEDLSITGFDDIELAAELPPGLTTLHVPSGEVGRRAAARLLERLAGREVAREEQVPVELIVRGTTGPVP